MKQGFRIIHGCFSLHQVSKRKIILKKHQQLLNSRNQNSFSFLGFYVLNRNFSSSSQDMENVIKSPYQDVVVPEMQLANFLWDENSKRVGDKIALVRLESLLS